MHVNLLTIFLEGVKWVSIMYVYEMIMLWNIWRSNDKFNPTMAIFQQRLAYPITPNILHSIKAHRTSQMARTSDLPNIVLRRTLNVILSLWLILAHNTCCLNSYVGLPNFLSRYTFMLVSTSEKIHWRFKNVLKVTLIAMHTKLSI